MVTVYISSTYEDLKEYRRTLNLALLQSGYTVKAMEYYVATDKRPVDKCLEDVQKSDIYVGLFAFRYGYVPKVEHNNPDGLSITELEYRCAKKEGIPCLVFLANEEAKIYRQFDDRLTGENGCGSRITELRKYLEEEWMSGFFSQHYELASIVQSALTKKVEELEANAGKHPRVQESPQIIWDIAKDNKVNPPFPGLKHFSRFFASVFFGRAAETQTVLDLFYEQEERFIIVSGDSGSGKSSLVDAGVLTRLEENGIPEGKSCHCVRMLPSQGSDPFDALMRTLHPVIEKAGYNSFELGQELRGHPQGLPSRIQEIIANGMDKDILVIFIDQMEELFTVRGKEQSRALTDAFLSALYLAVHEGPVRVVATIRSDFLHFCHNHRDMLQVLRGSGHYPLGWMEPYMLYEIIVKPCQCAGLTISNALVNRLINDAGSDPGNLPLLAFVLERLFFQRDANSLTEDAYEKLGGIQGAISNYIVNEVKVGDQFTKESLELLPSLFPSLIIVSTEGHVTRRRFQKSLLSPEIRTVAESLIEKRLLTTEEGGGIISIAHEKLFTAWPALSDWIKANVDDLQMLRQAEISAIEWEKNECDIDYLWPADRLKKLQPVILRLGNNLSDDTNAGSLQSKQGGDSYEISPLVQQFAFPQNKLINTLSKDTLGHQRRREMFDELIDILGDPRPGIGIGSSKIPCVDWVEVPEGEVHLRDVGGQFKVNRFRIARYPVTNIQYHAFENDEDGYKNDKWWACRVPPDPSRWDKANHPRENVSWFEAVAFCRWLTEKYRERGFLNDGEVIRLPTEWEWQQAATGGDPGRIYPWGAQWDGRLCNSEESALLVTTAVGMYPNGTWEQGPLDMAGNVWEWCLNTFEVSGEEESVEINSSRDPRAIRGGSWHNNREQTSCMFRGRCAPDYSWKNGTLGFRVALVSSP